MPIRVRTTKASRARRAAIAARSKSPPAAAEAAAAASSNTSKCIRHNERELKNNARMMFAARAKEHWEAKMQLDDRAPLLRGHPSFSAFERLQNAERAAILVSLIAFLPCHSLSY